MDVTRVIPLRSFTSSSLYLLHSSTPSPPLLYLFHTQAGAKEENVEAQTKDSEAVRAAFASFSPSSSSRRSSSAVLRGWEIFLTRIPFESSSEKIHRRIVSLMHPIDHPEVVKRQVQVLLLSPPPASILVLLLSILHLFAFRPLSALTACFRTLGSNARWWG